MGKWNNIQVGPVRWIYIKSPIPRQPYTHIRRIYEIELANSKSKNLSDLEKSELIKIKDKTRLSLKRKQQKEASQNIIISTIIMIIAILIVYLLI